MARGAQPHKRGNHHHHGASAAPEVRITGEQPLSHFRKALAWCLAAAAGASIFGSWRLWGYPLPEPFTASAFAPVVFAMAAGALAGLAGAALLSWLAGRFFGLDAAARTEAMLWSAAVMPLAWLPVGGVDDGFRIWTIFYIALVGGAGLMLGLFRVRDRLRVPELTNRQALWILGIAAALVGMSYSMATILGFWHFINCSYTDSGGFHNAMWNTAHGRLMQCDYWSPGSLLNDHFCFFLVLLSPVLWIYQNFEILLVIQAFSLVAAAFPLYFTARRETPRFFALALALAFLFSPFLNRIVLYEFHDLAFATLTLSLLVWACHGSVRTWVFLLLGLLALSVREDMAIPVLCVGLWEAAVGRRPRRGGVLCAMAVLWGFLCINLFMPSASAHHWVWKTGGAGHMERYADLGSSYGAIVKNLLLHPTIIAGHIFRWKILPNHFLLFFPLLFLPWLSPTRLLVFIPIFMLHIMSGWGYQVTLECQYSAPLLPLLFFAASGGAAVWVRKFGGTAPAGSGESARLPGLWAILGCGMLMLTLLSHLFFARWEPGIVRETITPYDGARHMNVAAFPWRPMMWKLQPTIAMMHEFSEALPARASVAVTDQATAAFTARPMVRAFRSVLSCKLDPLDFVLFASSYQGTLNREQIIQMLKKINADPSFCMLWSNGDFYLFARSSRITPELLARLEALSKKHGITPVKQHQSFGIMANTVHRADLLQREVGIVLQMDPKNDWANKIMSQCK